MAGIVQRLTRYGDGESRPVAWRSYVVAMLLAAYLLVLLFASRDSAAPPTLGLRALWDEESQAWIVAEIHPISVAQNAGIQRGDVILQADGRSLPGEGAVALAMVNGATQVAVQRPATGQLIPVSAADREPNRAAFFLISIVFFAVGAAVLGWGRGVAAHALTLVCCVAAGELAILPVAYRQVQWALLCHGLLLPLFASSFAYLFLVFPVQWRLRIGRRRLPPGLVPLSALPVATAWILTMAVAPAQFLVFQRLVLLYLLGCLTGGSIALAWSWWHLQPGRERTQLRIMTFGSLLAVLPFLAFSLLPRAVIGHEIVRPELSILPIVLMPAAFGYAILRYQLLNLQLYVRRGLVYAAVAATIVSIYTLALFAATLLVENNSRIDNIVAAAVMVGVITIAGERLRNALQRQIDRLFDRHSYDYRQQLLEFSRRMSSTLNPDELAQSTIELIAQTMGASHTRLYLYEPATRCYRLWSAVGLEPTPEQQCLPPRHPLLEKGQDQGAIVQWLDVPAAAEALSVPLQNKGQPVALLTLGPKSSELPYSREDLALLRTVANQLAVATENAQLYTRTRDLYLSGIRTLAATVDAKDPYTRGHSERVAAYSRLIAETLELPQPEIETIELAGLLHDIGKIGVPDAVLQKPGRLDPDERAMIMEHVAFGAKILADNPALSPLVPLVRHHHEWYAGGGYPDSLAGDAIPLGAAIISVADTFDTMTTDRPYRRAPGRDQARAEIARCSGIQFHPRVVAALLRVIESGQWLAEPAQIGANGLAHHPLAGRITTADIRAASIVYKVAQIIGEVTKLESFIARVIELLRRELGNGSLDIFLIEEGTGTLCGQARRVESPEHDRLRIAAGQGIVGWVAAHQTPIRLDDTHTDPRVFFVDGWEGRSELAVPLVIEGRTIGVINVESRRVGAFIDDDEALLTIVAQQLAQAIAVAQLHDQLKRNASIDDLTGVANHRHFYERLEEELARATRAAAPLSVLLLDVDGLKSLNDTHGHLAGDAALRTLAALLKRESRAGDIVARYGGDEFVVILPGLDGVGATAYAERCARAQRDATITLHGQAWPLPPFSYGAASYGADGDRTVALVAAADARMYRHKTARAATRDQHASAGGLAVAAVLRLGSCSKSDGGNRQACSGDVQATSASTPVLAAAGDNQ